ncbi:hypothetical protein J3E69DRAFT_360290 [Trichoderma sp. SZMC 28015]
MSKSRSRFSVRLAGTYLPRRTSTNHLPGDREKRGVGEWGRCGAMTSYCPMNMRYCSHPSQRGLGHCVSEPAQPLLLATLGPRPSESSARKALHAWILCLAPLILLSLGATSGWPGSATSEYSRRHRAPRPADCRPSMGQVLVPLQYPATGCCGTTPDRTPG